MDRNQLICVCEDVTAGKIIDAIREYGCLEEVKRCTRACVTCFGCEMELEELYEEYAPNGAEPAIPTNGRSVTDNDRRDGRDRDLVPSSGPIGDRSLRWGDKDA